MPLDRQCAAVLEAAAEAGSAFEADDIEAARQAYDDTTSDYAPRTADLARVRERAMPGPDGAGLPVRIYDPVRPADIILLPVLVFLHGGGWAMGGLETHDAVCRHLAYHGQCMVVSVDYRLAPENKFPAAVEDCEAALAWVTGNAGAIGGDPKRVAIGGDSAGGNLAAVVARRYTRQLDPGAPHLALQLLIYPATDFTADNGSIRDNGQGYLLTKPALDRFRDLYLRGECDWSDPDASPLLARDLSGLPPAFIQTGEFDPLRDEGRAYGKKLRGAGVPVEEICYPGMIHGFTRMGALVDVANQALDDSARALRAAFADKGTGT